jgi:hypothetical protein
MELSLEDEIEELKRINLRLRQIAEEALKSASSLMESNNRGSGFYGKMCAKLLRENSALMDRLGDLK